MGHESLDSGLCHFLRRRLAGASVTLVGHAFAHFVISLSPEWLRSGQAIYIAVIHAEGSGDQHGVVNLFVGGSHLPGREPHLRT